MSIKFKSIRDNNNSSGTKTDTGQIKRKDGTLITIYNKMHRNRLCLSFKKNVCKLKEKLQLKTINGRKCFSNQIKVGKQNNNRDTDKGHFAM